MTLRGLDRFDTFTTDFTQKLEITTSHLPTKEVVAESLSENADQMKSWAEMELKGPILEKIEVVENWTRSISNSSMQGSEDIRSLSDAVSSMSSEISRLREVISDPKRPKHRRYCCDAILGIEEAF